MSKNQDFERKSTLDYAVKQLETHDLKNEENLAIVEKHDRPAWFVKSLVKLKEAGISVEENRDFVASHTVPMQFSEALVALKRHDISIEENRDILDILAKHVYPGSVSEGLIALKEADIPIKDNGAIVASGDFNFLRNSVHALVELKKAGILTHENRAAVTSHSYPSAVSEALVELKKADILTHENRDIVAGYAHPLDISGALVILKNAGFLEAGHHERITQHENPQNAIAGLYGLNYVGILTPDNFNALLAPNHAAILNFTGINVFEEIPEHLFTEENFQRLLTASEQANPIKALDAVVKEILGIGIEVAPPQPSQAAHGFFKPGPEPDDRTKKPNNEPHKP